MPTAYPAESSRFVALVTNPKGQVIFAVLALCAIIVFNAFFFIFEPNDGIEFVRENTFGEVYAVFPGGPAELAGVQVGDVALAIDGRQLDPRRSEPRYRPGIRPGDAIRFELQRGEQTLTLELTAGAYTDDLAWLASNLGIQALSVGLWTIGLLLTLFVSPEDVRARLLSLGFLLAGVTAAVGEASGWNSFWGANSLQLILLSLLAPLLIAAHLTFPAVSFPRRRRQIINGVLVLTLLLVGIVAVEEWFLTSRGLSLADWVGLSLRQVVLIYFMLAWLGAVGLLLRNRFLSRDPEIRRQTGIILWGMVLGLGPFFALTLLPYLMFGTEYVGGFYTILFLLLLPLAYAYVIFQRNLLRVDFIINRIMVFFALVLLILIVSILLFGVVALALNLPTELPLLGGLVAAIIALPSASVQMLIQRKVNHVLYGSHYDFSSVTAGLSSQLAKTLDRDSLVELLIESLSRQMGINQAELLLIEGDQLELQGSGERLFSAGLDDEMCVVLHDSQRPVRALNLWGLLSSATQARWVKFNWGQLFVPLIFEDRLHGILVLGARSSGDVYSDQDIQIIATVAHQGALASANVMLVEDLRGLAQQLVRSDEAQRKRLARDLHDAVLQDLFFIKQRLPRDQPYQELAGHLEALIQRLRGLIKTQRPTMLDQGLRLALQGLVEEMQRIAGDSPRITWVSDLEDPLNLTDEQATSIFRIAQEALNNALKHAEARTIAVKLERASAGVLRLSIDDDGIGVSAAGTGEGSQGQQYGLVGMRERARMIAARLEVGPRPEGGTAVVLEFRV